MSFHEKSAWVMSAALLVTGILYGYAVFSHNQLENALPTPLPPLLITYTVILVLIAILGHIFIAIQSPKEADADADEREQKIIERAGYLSSYVMGTGLVMSLLAYLFHYNGDALFYMAFASLVISQISEYVLQIFFFRTRIG